MGQPIKVSNLFELTYRSNTIPIKILEDFIIKIDMLILKLV